MPRIEKMSPEVVLDYKKAEKHLYAPKLMPMLIEIPSMNFMMIQGSGNPADPTGEYSAAVEAIYSLSYAIKMSERKGCELPGYFKYAVPRLESLWWLENEEMNFSEKEKFQWIAMIHQPEFVTDSIFEWASNEVQRKKAHIVVDRVRFQAFVEGLSVQILHVGSYEDESRSLKIKDECIAEKGYVKDFGTSLVHGMIRFHHEIYLNDPRKTDPSKIKTILRIPVKKKG